MTKKPLKHSPVIVGSSWVSNFAQGTGFFCYSDFLSRSSFEPCPFSCRWIEDQLTKSKKILALRPCLDSPPSAFADLSAAFFQSVELCRGHLRCHSLWYASRLDGLDWPLSEKHQPSSYQVSGGKPTLVLIFCFALSSFSWFSTMLACRIIFRKP